MKNETIDYIVKFMLLGDSSVGKTNIIRSISGKPFQPRTMTTLGQFKNNFKIKLSKGLEFETKIFDVEDKRIKVQIWDTAGQDRLRTVTRSYYQGANGMILVYSVIDRESFEHITSWIEEINTYGSSNVSIILVGNKIDLPNRDVSFEEGQQLAQKFKLPFYETSAKTGENIENIFLELGKVVKNKLYEENKSSQPNDDNKIHIQKPATLKTEKTQVAQNQKQKKCC